MSLHNGNCFVAFHLAAVFAGKGEGGGGGGGCRTSSDI